MHGMVGPEICVAIRISQSYRDIIMDDSTCLTKKMQRSKEVDALRRDKWLWREVAGTKCLID